MAVTVRPFRRGTLDVDISLRLSDGRRIRVRKVAPCRSKAAAKRWGEAIAREILRNDAIGFVPEPEPAVPTLAEFAPRFIDGYARANRQKPSTIASKRGTLKTHLIPMFGTKRLDEIGNEDVQHLKRRLEKLAPSSANNTLSVLSKLLKVAVEWGVIEKMPCTIKLLHRPHVEMRFHDFAEYERLVEAARRIDSRALAVILLGGEAGLRSGEMLGLEWHDVDQQRRELNVRRSVWKGHVTEPKSGRPRRIPMTERLAEALASHRHLRSPRVICRRTGRAMCQQELQRVVIAVERLANVEHLGVHALRHTFCSHLSMRGAPAGAIQALAGHSELITTQRYMHLSPAAKESAIRLLEQPAPYGEADACKA
ncbi:MAG: tyrosine-type recombinase/integrase [bacterium]